LTNRDDSWWMINILGEALIPLFLTAISRSIFLRGALSVGKFYQSDNMVIGPAVKDAANYYNRPKWVGICTAPTASKVLDKEWGTMGMALDIFGKYDIPIGESSSEQGWALLWPKRASQGTAQRIIQQKSEYYYKKGKRDIYLKFKRTLDFCG
jgi:hypothetical protein